MLRVMTVLSLILTTQAALAAEHAALKNVPANLLNGVTVVSCEEKEPTSQVVCRNTGKCTITIVSGRVTCKGTRK